MRRCGGYESTTIRYVVNIDKPNVTIGTAERGLPGRVLRPSESEATGTRYSQDQAGETGHGEQVAKKSRELNLGTIVTY
jgi:hypothetical protein